MACFKSKDSHVLVYSIIYLHSIGVPSHALLRVMGVVSLGSRVQIVESKIGSLVLCRSKTSLGTMG